MASQATVPTEDVASPSKDSLKTLSSKVSNEQEGAIGFRFKLPLNGLALRSAAVIDGIPELRFGASPKVPTLTEEDVAIAFLLASEGKRPEFAYIPIPQWHPFYGRQFKHYTPAWLRGTSVGELLSETDWSMKCLHVGVQSNSEKSKFWSWQKKSNLDGLATRLDFPDDNPSGSVFMSCESAIVETNETEIVFPEEPKMRIVDESSSLYTKYITEIFPSVAYHDEMLFLKVQELIKLILVAEWLLKKEVKISKEWMMRLTSKSCESGSPQNEVKEPPRMLTPPQPTEIRRPTSDVHVKSNKAEQSQFLVKQGWQWWYGWIDVGGKEMIWFDEDGAPCEQNKSVKMVIKQQMSIGGLPALKVSGLENFPLPPISGVVPTLTSTEVNNHVSVKDQEPIPHTTHEEITGPFGSMSVDVTFDDNINNDDGKEMKITRTVTPPPHISAPKVTHTTTVKASIDDYDMLYSHEDPNMPIRPNVPGVCEEVCPQVQSWSELFRETVPWPHVSLVPPSDLEAPVGMESGGVSTKHIPVKEEPREIRKTTISAPRVDQYIKRDDMVGVQPQRQVIHGEIRCASQQEFAQVSAKFKRDWQKGTYPGVEFVFVITNPSLKGKWDHYRNQLSIQTVEQYYHGTSLTCNITSSKTLCANMGCGVCGISSDGLKRQFIRKNIMFQRFGHGYYLAPHSSKCHDYTQGAHGYRAMLLCDVYPGRKYPLETNSQQLTGPPAGYNSVYGQVTASSELNFPEIVVYNPEAVLPRYIIVYRKNGVGHPLEK